MKLIIAGSRKFPTFGLSAYCDWLDIERIKPIYNILVKAIEDSKFEFDTIISGGAWGMDYLGEKYAKENNITLQVQKADWKAFGRSAGYIRNRQMAKAADYLICIHCNSSGSLNMIKQMLLLEKPYYEKVIN